MAGAASAHWIKHVELLSGFDPDTTLGGVGSCGLRPEDGPSFPVRPSSHSLSSLGSFGLLPGLSGTVLHLTPSLYLLPAVYICGELRWFLLRGFEGQQGWLLGETSNRLSLPALFQSSV